MNDDHARWRRQVLALDDLAGESRAAAQAHLDACPDCTALLRKLREHERAPAQLRAWGGPAHADAEPSADLSALSAREQAEADASLAALRARVGGDRHAAAPGGTRTVAGTDPAAGPTPRPRRAVSWRPAGRRWIAWGVPLAAAAAVLLLWRAPASGPLAPDSLRVVAPGVQRGEAQPSSVDVWRTGDAFALRFELRRPAFPVVFHVDPALRVSLLHPVADEPAPREPTPAGVVVLPDPERGERWVLEGAPGPETFLVVASGAGSDASAALLDRAQRLSDHASTRAALLQALRGMLQTELGSVQMVELTHQP